MATVNKLDKKVKMSNWDVIRLQIMIYCHLSKMAISHSDINCLSLLAKEGSAELTSFCNKAHSEYNILSSVQSIRNSLAKLEKKKLIIKDGKNKKKIYINPDMNVLVTGNILLNYNFLALETT